MVKKLIIFTNTYEISDLHLKWVRLAPNETYSELCSDQISVHFVFVQFGINLTQFRPKSDIHGFYLGLYSRDVSAKRQQIRLLFDVNKRENSEIASS